jgi:hypothetical protein
MADEVVLSIDETNKYVAVYHANGLPRLSDSEGIMGIL